MLRVERPKSQDAHLAILRRLRHLSLSFREADECIDGSANGFPDAPKQGRKCPECGSRTRNRAMLDGIMEMMVTMWGVWNSSISTPTQMSPLLGGGRWLLNGEKVSMLTRVVQLSPVRRGGRAYRFPGVALGRESRHSGFSSDPDHRGGHAHRHGCFLGPASVRGH